MRTPNDTTPNSDSYVSTSETIIEPPASKAQVLEELKARIRELEGSPHYKCFMCKVGKFIFEFAMVLKRDLFWLFRKNVKRSSFQPSAGIIYARIAG